MTCSAEPRPVRSAEQGATPELDPALVRLAVNGLCEQQAAIGKPMRRSEARRLILERLERGALDLRNVYGVLDPTGEKAAIHVDHSSGAR